MNLDVRVVGLVVSFAAAEEVEFAVGASASAFALELDEAIALLCSCR